MRKEVGLEESGWNEEHSRYMCADMCAVTIKQQAKLKTRQKPAYQNVSPRSQRCRNELAYAYQRVHGSNACTVLVSGMEASRSMGTFIRQTADTKTIIVPRSVTVAEKDAFQDVSQLAVVEMSEGLEKLCEMKGWEIFESWPAKKVRLPSTLRLFGNNAMAACTLRNIQLPAGLEVLGTGCFRGFGGQTIHVPASVREIEDSAFYDSCIRTIVFLTGSKLERIGKQCFCDSTIKEFVSPASLREVGAGAFQACRWLKRVVLNEGLQVLGLDRGQRRSSYVGIFEDSAVEEVVFSSTLRKLGPRTFCCCKALKSIQLPNCLETIGAECFRECGIQRIIIPASVKEIGDKAFSDCSDQAIVTFEANSQLEDIKKNAFENSENLVVLVQWQMKFLLEKYFEQVTVLRLPDFGLRVCDMTIGQLRNAKKVILPEGLEAIESSWFADSGIEEIVISASVREIGRSSFRGCRKLRQIEFAEGSVLERIGERAFCGAAIEQFVAPGSLRAIASGAFYQCKKLRKVTLNEDLQVFRIDEHESSRETYCGIFEECGVQNVSLPATLQRIERRTFKGCKDLKQLCLPAKLKAIQGQCFQESGLEEVTLPDGVVEIPEYAFQKCYNLRQVKFGEGSKLSYIGTDAFRGTGLDVFVAPHSLRTICKGAFCECAQLRRVVLNEGLEILGTRKCLDDDGGYCGVFQESTVEDVSLPSTLKAIEQGTFCWCSNLKRITLPTALETIQSYAFKWSGLEEFTAPSSLRTIAQGAFYKCEHLKRVVLNDGLEVLGEECFRDAGILEVHIPRTVKVVGKYAFCGCQWLQALSFDDGSEPEKIEDYAFCSTPLRRSSVAIPAGTVVAETAFDTEPVFK